MNNDVQGFLSNLPKWTKFFDSVRLPPAVAEDKAIGEIKQRLGNIRRRLRDGPDAPLRIAFFGPTGAGKSKLFGSLIQDNFSGSGFKRPFTRRSFYYLHDYWKPLAASLAGELSLHQQDGWRDIILIDTPDFDSVEVKNRAEAERVFLESDGFLFVTDALKYADASTWEYLEKIHSAGKIFAVVLNKVKSDAVAEGFRERFERTLTDGKKAEYQQVTVPEFRIDDATLIDPEHEAMQDLRNTAKRLVRGDDSRQKASITLLRSECTSFCTYSDDVLNRITTRRTQIEDAKQSLARRADAAKRRLSARLESGLEPAVRQDVYQDVLRRLERIDVLRYPRKLMEMPVQGVKSLFSSWLPGSKDDQPPEEPAFADPVSSKTFHLLESELIAFADQSRNDISSRAGLESLINRDTFKDLRFSHEELQTMYVEHHEKFASWVAAHAQETAAEITGENKVKFALAQVMGNGLLLSLWATSGGITGLEYAAQGAISPWIAKGVSNFIGSEKVKEFETSAHAEHERALCELLDQGRMRFEQYLDKSCIGLDDLEQNLNEISDSRSLIDSIVKHFEGVEHVASTSPTTPQNNET